jgi:hypothetical protein
MFTDLMLCFVAVRAKGDASENAFIDPAGLHLTFDLPAWEHAQVSGFNVAVRAASKAGLVVNVGVPGVEECFVRVKFHFRAFQNRKAMYKFSSACCLSPVRI